MTMIIRIRDVVFVDLKKTPKRIVDKAAATARQKHPGVSLEYLSEIDVDKLSQGGRVEFFKALVTKPGEPEDWPKPTRKAINAVRSAKQTFLHELWRSQELVEMLRDVYGLEPTEGGD